MRQQHNPDDRPDWVIECRRRVVPLKEERVVAKHGYRGEEGESKNRDDELSPVEFDGTGYQSQDRTGERFRVMRPSSGIGEGPSSQEHE